MSSPSFVLTPQARDDLRQIWDYIAEDNPESADEVLEKLYRCVCAIGSNSGNRTSSRRLGGSATSVLERIFVCNCISLGVSSSSDSCSCAWIAPFGGIFSIPDRQER